MIVYMFLVMVNAANLFAAYLTLVITSLCCLTESHYPKYALSLVKAVYMSGRNFI
jgi:hypothetical protein